MPGNYSFVLQFIHADEAIELPVFNEDPQYFYNDILSAAPSILILSTKRLSHRG